MNYYNEIKNKLVDNEIYEKVKDYSKERNRVLTYFEVGKLLHEAGNKYGDNVIGKYSERLVKEVGKKYNRRTLFRMRQVYNVFNNEKVSTLWTQLTWSHIRLLIGLDTDSINYYIQVALEQHISVRELEYKIKCKEYERLPEETKKKIINKEETNIVDLVKNPVIIKNPNKYEIVTEKVLARLILEDIPSFLEELGSGFTFIKNEYKIKLGNRYNYIDLLLFNYIYNSFVVVELKTTELKKEYIGQIEVYMNYIDDNIKKVNHNKTIGIIVCRQDNKYVIKYCSDKRILSKEYQIV